MTSRRISTFGCLKSLAGLAYAGVACLFLIAIPIQVAAAPPVAAGNPAAHDASWLELADPQALLLFRINKPLQVLDNPWLQQIWPLLEGSPTIRNALEPAMAGRLIETRQFLERASGTSWRQAVEKLTEGGIELSLQKRVAPIPSQVQAQYPFAALVVIHAADEKLLGKFLAAADHERREQSAAQSRDDAPVASSVSQVSRYAYRGQSCTKVLKGADRPGEYFAVVGRRFLFTTDEKVLEQAIGRCLDGASVPPAAMKAAVSPAEPLVRFAMRLDALREFPQVREWLELPANQPWIAPFVGAWDSLRRSDRLQGSVRLESTGIRLQVRCAAGTIGMPAGLRTATTASNKEPLLPSLQIPNSVSTLNLYRDALLLWQNRSDWLSTEGVALVEEWNRLPQGQIPGLNFLQALPFVGPHWRMAMALPAEPIDRSKRRDLLPAFAITVDLRDEPAFRREVLDKLEAYLRSPAGKAHGRLETWDHHGTQVSQFHWNPPAFPPGFSRPPGDFRNPRGSVRPGEGRSTTSKMVDSKTGDTKVADVKPGEGKPQEPQLPLEATAVKVPPRDSKLNDPRAGELKGKSRQEGIAGSRNFRGGTARTMHHGRHRRSGASMFRHMHPGCAIRNGQLIVGSTSEIIRQTIDELERQSQVPATAQATASVSSEQFLSLERLAEHLRSRERILRWRLVRSAEISEEQAKEELAAFTTVLSQLGDISYRETATETSLEIDVRLGKPAR